MSPPMVTYVTIQRSIPYFGTSRTRRRILEEFFLHPDLMVHVRELARRLDLAPAVIGRELGRLEAGGVLRSEWIGRSRRYQLDDASPIAREARALFQKTLGVEAVLRSALEDVPGIEEAFIFGSYASGTESPGSDIDVMIIGQADREFLSERLADAEERLGREINTVRMPRDEFDREGRAATGFVAGVLANPRVHLVGGG